MWISAFPPPSPTPPPRLQATRGGAARLLRRHVSHLLLVCTTCSRRYCHNNGILVGSEKFEGPLIPKQCAPVVPPQCPQFQIRGISAPHHSASYGLPPDASAGQHSAAQRSTAQRRAAPPPPPHRCAALRCAAPCRAAPTQGCSHHGDLLLPPA
eukprot:gene13205-biopygen12538